MKRKYAVFDWDGTLADTYPIILDAYHYTFNKMGILKIDDDDIKKIISTLQNKDILGYFFKERQNEAVKYFYEYIEQYHTKNLKPIEGAAQLLEYCKKKDIICYLLTNKKTYFIYKEMEKLGFQKYFKKVVAAGEYSQDKPHPTACLAVFDGILPPVNQIVVIGDGAADVKTANVYKKGNQRARCIILDPKNQYCGETPDDKVKYLVDIQNLLERE